MGGCRQAFSITNKKSINGTEKEKGRGRAGCPRREDGRNQRGLPDLTAKVIPRGYRRKRSTRRSFCALTATEMR